MRHLFLLYSLTLLKKGAVFRFSHFMARVIFKPVLMSISIFIPYKVISSIIISHLM